MGKMRIMKYGEFSIPYRTAQDVQKRVFKKENDTPISLQALGLLVNLLSYEEREDERVDGKDWELHKTELYKRFGKNKENSVRSAWNDLVESGYIIEFKYRVGNKWDYVYFVRKTPFSPEEKAEILDNAEKEFGEIWGLDFQDLKMKTSKSRDNLKDLDINKSKDLYKDINKNIDDDKRTSSPVHTDEELNVLISNFREETKEELSERSFKSVVKKVLDKYRQGKIEMSFRDYLATSLINKIEELDLRRTKDSAKKELRSTQKQNLTTRLNNFTVSENLPFYDWLNED